MIRSSGPAASIAKANPAVATSGTPYGNLADLLQHQGKYDQAEPLYRRANENPAQGMGSGAG